MRRLLEVEAREIVEEQNEVGMVGAEIRLADRQGAGEQRLGVLRIAAHDASGAETCQRGNECEIVGTLRVLADVEGSTERLLGFGVVAHLALQRAQSNERGGELHVQTVFAFDRLNRGAK